MYLLDTSALIVHMFNSQTFATLSKEAAEIVRTAEHLFISDITLWELAIKAKIGKITLGKTIVEGMSLITTDEKIRTHEYGVKVIW